MIRLMPMRDRLGERLLARAACDGVGTTEVRPISGVTPGDRVRSRCQDPTERIDERVEIDVADHEPERRLR